VHIDHELDGMAPVHPVDPAAASDKVEKGGVKESGKTRDEEVLSRLGSFASCLISGARYCTYTHVFCSVLYYSIAVYQPVSA
jgi:hypothetical protein